MKLFIMFFIFALLLAVVGLYEHELQHQQIYDHYGIESKIHIGFPAVYVEAINATEEREKCGENCILSQEINDSISYNMQAIPVILIVGFAYIIVIMENMVIIEKGDKNK